MATKNELIEKARTVCGAAHTIESKVLELKGHLLKYVGTVDLKNAHFERDCNLEDGTVKAEWNPEGRLISLAGVSPSTEMESIYRLVIVEKIELN